MGLVTYCGEINADLLNMAEIILRQPRQAKCRGYFNLRKRLPEKDKYDLKMSELTSKLRECKIR